jgi:hypothetical protein
MSPRKLLLHTAFALWFTVTLTVAASAEKKLPPPPPAHATSPSPAVTDEFIHKQFGDNCSLLPGPPQFVGDMDDDGIDDLVVAARCKNPMADKDEYNFVVADPYDSFFGYSDVKVTSTVRLRRTRSPRHQPAHHSRRGKGRMARRKAQGQVPSDQCALWDSHREKTRP